jgi:hypothetical protein
VTNASASFADKHVGLGKAVTVSGIGISGPDAGNYTLGNWMTNTTADITKALLTVIANDQSRPYGQANPVFTITYVGFVNGEGTNDLDSLPTAGTTATSASPFGDYPITLAGGVDGDYAFSFVDGTLSVTDAPLEISSITVNNGVAVITWSATAGRTYRLQCKEEPTDLNWTDLGPDVPATGPIASATNPVGNVPQRLYRLVVVEGP